MRSRQFASLLLRYRRRAGLTQQQLADLSTVSSRAIRDLEKGRIEHPRRATVQLLADALRTDNRERDLLEQSASESVISEPDLCETPMSPSQEELFEYKTLRLGEHTPASLKAEEYDLDALNKEAKQGWRLVAVERNVAFLEREVSDAYSEPPPVDTPNSARIA